MVSKWLLLVVATLFFVSFTQIAYPSGGDTPGMMLFADCSYENETYISPPGEPILLTAILFGGNVASVPVVFSYNGNTTIIATDDFGFAETTVSASNDFGYLPCTASATGFGNDSIDIAIGRIDGILLSVSPTVTIPSTGLEVKAYLYGLGNLSGKSITLHYYNSSNNEITSKTTTTSTQIVTDNGEDYYVATFSAQTAPDTAGDYTVRAEYGTFYDVVGLTVVSSATQLGTVNYTYPGFQNNLILTKGGTNPTYTISAPSSFTYNGTNYNISSPAWKYAWGTPIYSGSGRIKINGATNGSTVSISALLASSKPQDIILNLILTKVEDNMTLNFTGGSSPWKLTVIYPKKGTGYCSAYMKNMFIWRTANPAINSDGNPTYGFYRRWDFVPVDQFGYNIRQPIYWAESWHFVHGESNQGSGNSGPIQGSTEDTWGVTDGWGCWTQDMDEKAEFTEDHSGLTVEYHPVIGSLPSDWISTRFQVETATVVAPGGLTGNGNATITVTAAGMTVSPKVMTVPVNTATHSTAALIAETLRTALNADGDITTLFTVGATGTDITLTQKVATGDDATLNIAISTGTATGITDAPTSANTTSGIAITTIMKGVQNISWAGWDIHQNTLTMTTTPTVDGAIDPTNTAPVIATLSAVSPTQIEASIVDDGLPDPSAVVSLTWSKLNGPGTVTFSPQTISHSTFFWDSNKFVTTVSYSEPGTYTLRLRANDNKLQTARDIVVIVP